MNPLNYISGVKNEPAAPEAIKLSPRLQTVADYCVRSLRNKRYFNLNESLFQSTKELKDFRAVVYSGLEGDAKLSFFNSHYAKTMKILRAEIDNNAIMSEWCRWNGLIRLRPQTASAFHRLINRPEVEIKSTPTWTGRAIKVTEGPDLAYVCLSGHLQAAQILLKRDPSQASTSQLGSGSSAFHCATVSGNLELIRLIHASGGRPSAVNLYSFVVPTGDLELLKLLINEFPELPVIPEQISLGEVALFGDEAALAFFLDNGCEIADALHIVCKEGLNHLIPFLLGRGADPLKKDSSGRTTWDHAIISKNIAAIACLVSSHKERLLRSKKYTDGLFLACRLADKDLLELLMDDAVPRDTINKDGESLMHIAVQDGNDDIVRSLLQARFSPHLKDKEGKTPLHLASVKGELDMAAALLDENVDIHAEDKDGYPAIFFTGGRLMRALLLDRGANINHQQKSTGLTPLMYAIRQGYETVALELIDKGADWRILAENKMSAYTDALALGRKDVAARLYAEGAEETLSGNPEMVTAALRTMLEHITDFEECKSLTRKFLDLKADPCAPVNGTSATEIITFRRGLSEDQKISLLQMMAEAGANLNLGHEASPFLLHIASAQNLTRVVHYLLERGVQAVEDVQCHSLTNAIMHRNREMITALMESGSPLIPQNLENPTPFYMAIMLGLDDVALELCKKNAIALHTKAPFGALAWACINRSSIEVIEEVLAKTTLPLIEGETTPLHALLTPLHTSLNNLAMGTETRQLFESNPMGYRTAEEINKIAAALLDAYPQMINVKDRNGCTPLRTAIMTNQPLACIQHLMQKGADADESMWKSIFLSGNLDLYRFVRALGVADNTSLYTKLLYLDEPKHAALLEEVLTQHDDMEILELTSEQLSLRIPRYPEIWDAISPVHKMIFKQMNIYKMLGHTFAVNKEITQYGKAFTLDGSSRYMSTQLATMFRKHLDMRRGMPDADFSAQQHDVMKEAVKSLEMEISGTELAKSIRSGKPILLAGGFTRHFEGIVLFQHPETKRIHILICNRGGGPPHIGISESTLNTDERLPDMLNIINTYNFVTADGNSSSFKKTELESDEDIMAFWQEAGVDVKGITVLLEQYPQQGGFCGHDNLKGAFGALFYAQAILGGKSQVEALDIMLRSYKGFTKFGRNQTLESALQYFNEEYRCFNQSFFVELYDKIKADPRIEPALIEKLESTIERYSLADQYLAAQADGNTDALATHWSDVR